MPSSARNAWRPPATMSSIALVGRVSETPPTVFLRGSPPDHFLLSLCQGHRSGLHHIAYAMAGEEEVRRAARSLKAAGVRIVAEPHPLNTPGGGYALQFIDPDG